jgi:methylase of polypeptide subunit release factors
VASEQYQLIVSNPPFIVGPGFAPGAGGFRYRDSGLAGDAVCERLIRELPGRLSPCGPGQLLANWIIGNDTEWSERIAQWLAGSGCDAWIWQREVAEPGEYVSLWLRDSGQTPGSTAWITSYDAWMDWFAGAGVMAVGMGLVSIRRTGSDRPTVVCEDVAQPLEQPIGPEIANWFQRADWLREVELGSQSLVAPADLVRSQHSLLSADGWRPAITQLRQSHGMRWELEVDEAVAALVAACESGLPLSVVFSLLAATLDQPEQSVSQALLPVVGDLVQRGLLLPKL